MKLNNKGFAISTIMYMILIMAITLIVLTLSILGNRKLILDKTKQEALDNIYNSYEISYRQALETLKEEAILYAQANGIQDGSINVSDLNSSLDYDVLQKYNLNDKSLIITYIDNVYDANLAD